MTKELGVTVSGAHTGTKTGSAPTCQNGKPQHRQDLGLRTQRLCPGLSSGKKLGLNEQYI